jgi:hypothetical protein
MERLEDMYHESFTDEQIEQEYNYLTHHGVEQ